MIKGLLSLRALVLMPSGARGMAFSVDKVSLSNLRKRTGISFINCKKALEQFENDLDKAEKWLKEQAQKEGWTKATKLQNRSMSNGLVAVISNSQAATMIEVNCETDFVARNNKFINLTENLAWDCHKIFLQQPEPKLMLDRALVSAITVDGKSLADRIALEIGSIGENMALRRAVHLKEENSFLSTYVHASGPDIATSSDCHLGKYGVIISLTSGAKEEPSSEATDESESENSAILSLDEVSRFIGQHIVGMNPKLVGSLENDELAETKDEEDRLIFQEFLLDPNLTVGELLKNNGVTVNNFYRFACGEELPHNEQEN